jgi:hypothetical protein
MRTAGRYLDLWLLLLVTAPSSIAQTPITDENTLQPNALPSSSIPKVSNPTVGNVTPPDVLVSSGDLLAVSVL